ncbi:uncharacterized protein LOC131843030 [Achroia grisella]|uniref:uncharacterized protein LOC131843030 n=1 Tax=Achroia grisella TaxID=688607 RepID=UPI0027D2C36D|nr:uncharacterized protein LOC131843030 [Achroia grisella]
MATESVNEIAAMKRERKVIRTIFTRSVSSFETKFDSPEFSVDIKIQYKKLDELQAQLTTLDKEIRSLLRSSDDEDVLSKEIDSALEYREKWLRIDTLYKNMLASREGNVSKKSILLPKLEFIHFDGSLKNWLNYWGQFSKIDRDPNIDPTDKYQYLLQSMTPNTEVRRLVEGFIPSSYKECLEQLKSRFAREELLIQVYVRELLAMVNPRTQLEITPLYDKLSAQLRALDTLGVTKDKFAAFLLPMIESALPQEILQLWERAKSTTDVTTELTGLLDFLKREVETQQRVSMAKSIEEKGGRVKEHQMMEPTASCLLTKSKPVSISKPSCIWCEKGNHETLECYKLQRMSIDDRREYLKKQKMCTICLKKDITQRYAKHLLNVLCVGDVMLLFYAMERKRSPMIVQ